MTVLEAVEPKLRFNEFDGSWEEKRLGEVCNKIQDGNYGFDYPKSHEFLSKGVPFLTSKALGEDGEIINSKIDYISQEKHSSLKKAQIKPADILFTNRGANVGAIGEVGDFIEEGNIGPQLTLLRANREIILPKFLKYCMKTPVLNKQVRSQDSGSAMNFFGIKATSKFKLCIPGLIEQQKIADFLSAVDKKISLLGEKRALLEQYKKGVMQKLFKQEMRFKDDDGSDFPSWKLDAVGSYLEEFKERVPVDTELPVLTSSRTGLYLQERKVINDGEYGVLPKGYFTYRHMSDDLVFKFNLNRDWDKAAISKEYPVFRAVGMNSYFLELALNEGDDFTRFAIQQKVGGTRTRLYFKNLVKLKLPIPCLKEQNKIADFLQKIDEKIGLVKKQIELTQTFKKGLLQQMFV